MFALKENDWWQDACHEVCSQKPAGAAAFTVVPMRQIEIKFGSDHRHASDYDYAW
jgi:hypothetical protein